MVIKLWLTTMQKNTKFEFSEVFNTLGRGIKNGFINAKEKEIKKLDDAQEILVQERELKWIQETEICVVVSSEQNEIKKYLSDEMIKAGLEKLIYKINSDDENMNDDVNMFFELLTSIYKNENTIKPAKLKNV